MMATPTVSPIVYRPASAGATRRRRESAAGFFSSSAARPLRPLLGLMPRPRPRLGRRLARFGGRAPTLGVGRDADSTTIISTKRFTGSLLLERRSIPWHAFRFTCVARLTNTVRDSTRAPDNTTNVASTRASPGPCPCWQGAPDSNAADEEEQALLVDDHASATRRRRPPLPSARARGNPRDPSSCQEGMSVEQMRNPVSCAIASQVRSPLTTNAASAVSAGAETPTGPARRNLRVRQRIGDMLFQTSPARRRPE